MATTATKEQDRERVRRSRKRELRELRLLWLPVVRHDWAERQRCTWGYLFGWLRLHARWAWEDLRNGGDGGNAVSRESDSA